MKKMIVIILFFTLIFLGNLSVQAQKSPPTENICQPSIEEILSVVKSAYRFSPSPRGVWVAGEIQGGLIEIRIPKEQLPLTKAIAMLGGVLKPASGLVYLIRQPAENKEKTKVEINLNNIKQGIVKDIELEKGDLVFVPQGCVDGKLLQPIIRAFSPPALLTDSPIPFNKRITYKRFIL